MCAYVPHKIISQLIDNILNCSLKIHAAKGYEDATIAGFQRLLMLAEEYCIITFQIRKT
jgi:hypothetical protein